MGEGGESLEWRLPDYQQLLRMVKNPTYAGAYAWDARARAPGLSMADRAKPGATVLKWISGRSC